VHTPFSINCKGRLLSWSQPIVMGIINATPDSFYNQGRDNTESQILWTVEKMLQEGATIIDIGGMSSKPGAEEIKEAEELQRVIPILEKVKSNFPDAYLSIDTFRAEVAKQAVAAGADSVNDISAGAWDPEIVSIAAKNKVPYIAMHMQGKPKNMQQNPTYGNVCEEVYDFFVKTIKQCSDHEIYDILIDVGFGFGKTLSHNYELLYNLSIFKNLHKPILVGISRKSMVCKPLHVNPENALNGSTALHMLALQNGASILRVHDVKEAMECLKLFEIYSNDALS
jgi:dihydropteroate synthase